LYIYLPIKTTSATWQRQLGIYIQGVSVYFITNQVLEQHNPTKRRRRLTRKKRYQKIHVSFLCALLIFLFLPSSTFSSIENLVPNVEGKIQVVILHYGDGSWGTFWHDQTVFFRDLMDKMNKDVAFVVLHGKDDAAKKIQKILKPYAEINLPDGTPRVKFLTVDVKTVNFYPWSRDGYLILSDGNENLTFLDVGFARKPFPITNFNEVFKDAKSLAGVIHRGGGNIRTTHDEIVIGMDTMLGINIPSRGSWFSTGGNLLSTAQSLKPKDVPGFQEKFDAYCLFLQRVLAPNRKLVVPGKKDFFARLEKGDFPFESEEVWHTGAQAAYHTDVYLGLGHVDEEGKRIAFIADSKLGAKVIEDMTPEKRRELESRLPAILEKEGFSAAGIPVTAEQISDRFQWESQKLLDKCLEMAGEVSETLDKSATRMEELGYRIVRIPYLPNGLISVDFSTDIMGMSFNYSNVLVEVYDGVRRVYMPDYDFPQLDLAAAQAYKDAGYEVIQIKGYVTHGLSMMLDGAGLDCLTSEIRHPVRWADKYSLGGR